MQRAGRPVAPVRTRAFSLSRFRLRGVGDFGNIGTFIGGIIPSRWIVAREVTGMLPKGSLR